MVKASELRKGFYYLYTPYLGGPEQRMTFVGRKTSTSAREYLFRDTDGQIMIYFPSNLKQMRKPM